MAWIQGSLWVRKLEWLTTDYLSIIIPALNTMNPIDSIIQQRLFAFPFLRKPVNWEN
jgi:hypothetical protein